MGCFGRFLFFDRFLLNTLCILITLVFSEIDLTNHCNVIQTKYFVN